MIETKFIGKVRLINNTKVVTVPKESDIQEGDYVKITKIKL